MMSGGIYVAYGQRIRSSIPLPELREAEAGPARWDFSVVDHLPALDSHEELGRELIYGDVSAQFLRHTHGHRIRIDDTGEFDLSGDGRRITWQPNQDPWWDFGRSHLIGRVLATVLHLDGVLTLHASSVQLPDGVVGFLAPKHTGKSTLGLSLYKAGATFVTDDSLPIVPGSPIKALPGIHSLRVRPDDSDAERLVGRPIREEPGRDGKVFLPPLPAGRVLNESAPLGALYLVAPNDPAAEVAAAREALDPVSAAILLVGQTKIGAMLGPSFVSDILEVTSRLASSVPVYKLLIARDLARMDEVVGQIMDWHGKPDLRVSAPAGMWSE
jgi:hypothetical protein